ncbi:MAG: hypothetical protein GXP31_18040 [Kiritimatiellaeota bacterium]|nr:hypothetical protein [Kiritimatiellota bacterium]
MLSDEDHRVRRCPRLGHEVRFRYCRTQEGDRICPHILDCWWESFDVAGFLRPHLAAQEWERLVVRRPRPKVAGILELIQKARNAAGRTDGGD